MYLVWIAVVVEWRNPSGSAWVILVSGNGGHPSFQSDIVDCFWMDPSLILGSTVQPHRVASVLKRLDAPPKEDFQKIHARHSVPNELDHALHQHFYLGFLLRKHLQRRGFVHSVHGERRETSRLPRRRLVLAVEPSRLPPSDRLRKGHGRESTLIPHMNPKTPTHLDNLSPLIIRTRLFRRL